MKKTALVLALALAMSTVSFAQEPTLTPAGAPVGPVNLVIGATVLVAGVLLVVVGFDDEGEPIFATATATATGT